MRFGDRAWWTGFGSLVALLGAFSASACEESGTGAAQDDEASNARSGGSSRSTGTSSGSRSSSAAADDDTDDDDKSKADAGTSSGRIRDAGTSRSSSGSSSRDAGTKTGSTTKASVTFTIPFRAVVDGEEFRCGKSYTGIGTAKSEVTPQDLRVFVQDVKLLRKDGSEVDLELEVREPWQSAKVALLDFENASGDCADGTPGTNTKITGSAPDDDYVGISFSNGVPEDLNHLDPSGEDPPLSTSATLAWSWTQGFRFAKIELREVASAGQSFGSALFHVGSTSCTGSAGKVTCGKSNRNVVVLENFNPQLDTAVLDIAPLFKDTDLTQTVECHGTGTECEAMFEAFGLELSNGKAAKSQAVYSVE